MVRTNTAAEELRDEILDVLGDVWGIVGDGPDLSARECKLLSRIDVEDLERIAGLAEECAANVRAYATLAREVLSDKCD